PIPFFPLCTRVSACHAVNWLNIRATAWHAPNAGPQRDFLPEAKHYAANAAPISGQTVETRTQNANNARMPTSISRWPPAFTSADWRPPSSDLKNIRFWLLARKTSWSVWRIGWLLVQIHLSYRCRYRGVGSSSVAIIRLRPF